MLPGFINLQVVLTHPAIHSSFDIEVHSSESCNKLPPFISNCGYHFKIGAITSPIKQVNLIKIFIDGPVSLNGSPTVSP
jgi:hypothetical protein